MIDPTLLAQIREAADDTCIFSGMAEEVCFRHEGRECVTVLDLLSELDRLRAEAAELWRSGHGGATCADDGERDRRCVCCGKANPYR